jgi:virginiamycin B lyase
MKRILLILLFPTIAFGQEQPIDKISLATIHVEGFPDFLAANTDGVWVTNTDRVEKFTFGKSSPILTVPMPEPGGVMAIDFGSLWVVSCKEKSLYRINLQSGKIEAIIPSGISDPSGELSVAAGAGSIWLLTDSNGQLSRINRATNSISTQIRVSANSFIVDFGFNSIWVTNTENSTVQRIDPTTNQIIATIPVGPNPRFMSVGAGFVWTLNQGDGSVSKINPATNRAIENIPVGIKETGGDITAGKNKIFIRGKKFMLSVIDASTNKVTSRFGPPAGSGAVRIENGRVWITTHDINKIWVIKE